MTIQTNGTIAVPAPSRIGQATAVEQSRAVAEVQAAVVVAQQCPRDIQEALRQMRDSCNRMALAERAFFRVPRGGETVSRPSIHLARELARIWGNLDWGTAELRRDDGHKQSEMMAFAWDLQTNSRNRATFIVPHRRDTKLGPKDLSTQQDIYENNANNGARRLREVIFATLPSWFTEEAEQICAKRISEGDGEPLDTRITNCIDRYSKISITLAQLEAKTGTKRADWTPNDLAQLGVIYQSILRNEVSKEQEFSASPASVTAADLKPAGGAVQEGTPPAPAVPGPAGEPQRGTSPTVSPAGTVAAPVTDLKGGGADRPTAAASAAAPAAGPAAAAPAQTAPSGAPDPAAAASPAEPDSSPRGRRHKSTLGNLRNALGKLPFEAERDDLALLSRLTDRDITMIEGLRQDEAVRVLQVVDAALLAHPQDPEAALGELWGQARTGAAPDA